MSNDNETLKAAVGIAHSMGLSGLDMGNGISIEKVAKMEVDTAPILKTAKERDAHYDAVIAPVITQLAQLCGSQGMPMTVSVETWPTQTSRMHAGVSLAKSGDFRLIHMASEAGGNLDHLFKALVADAKKRGHTSVFLDGLGVPRAPAK